MLHKLEQKAKRGVERQQSAEEETKHRVVVEQRIANAQEVIHADIAATFGRRAGEAALVAGATVEQAMEEESSGRSICINDRCPNHERIGYW